MDGQEAETLGLVNYAVAQNEAGDAAYRKAETIAERILEKVYTLSHKYYCQLSYFAYTWFLAMLELGSSFSVATGIQTKKREGQEVDVFYLSTCKP